MRVGIIGLLQESNTFLPGETSWEHFEADVLARGTEVVAQFEAAQHEIGGFLEGLQQATIETVPIFVARALPFGIVGADCFARLREEILSGIRDAGPLDGMLVAPHGATVSRSARDADGSWLALVRQTVGSKMPILGTIDPHANLSQQMVAACDSLVAYRTNPHIDQRQRGLETALLMQRVLSEGIRPTMAAELLPMAISIECQCDYEEPCSTLHQLAEEIRAKPGVLSASIVLGFPYADVEEMGSAVIVVTEDDQQLAQQHARSLAEAMWNLRNDSVQGLPHVDEALEKAMTLESPVCLLDTGDNIGGGSPGDGTWLANALLAKQVERSLVCLHDEEAVSTAIKAGTGAKIRLRVGGRSGPPSGEPLESEFTVRSIHEGQFQESKPMHGGFSTFDQGPTVVLETQTGLTVIATSKRMVPFSLGQITSCGLDPASFRMLVAKGVNAPIAAYRQVCQSFVRVGTPGYTPADMTSFDFQLRRKPMFPFEQNAVWEGATS